MTRQGIIMVGQGQLADCGSNPDGLAYHTILSYRSDASQIGQQLRPKFADANASIPSSDPVPAGKVLTITELHVYSSLGYLVDDTTCGIQQLFDALDLCRWQAVVGPVVPPDLIYTETLPSSGLFVMGNPTYFFPGTGAMAALGQIPMSGTQSTGFSRSLTYPLPEAITIPAGQTLNIEMRLAKVNHAVEYDVWAVGQLDDVP